MYHLERRLAHHGAFKLELGNLPCHIDVRDQACLLKRHDCVACVCQCGKNFVRTLHPPERATESPEISQRFFVEICLPTEEAFRMKRSDCERCFKMLSEALVSSTDNAKVSRLLQSLNDGQQVKLQKRPFGFSAHLHDVGEMHIQCKRCSDLGVEGNARAFVMGPAQYSIVVCSNRVPSAEDMQQVLTHELVHIYDANRLQLDLRKCSALAYSEVRAAREAECAVMVDDDGKNARFKDCARITATHATMNLFPWRGRSCVTSVLDEAFSDQRPFVPSRIATSPQQRLSSRNDR